MKALGSYKHVTGYKVKLLLVAVALAPNLAMAAAHRAPAAQEACEAEAQSEYKKKAVEVEMTSIAGNFSELEVTSARESLQKDLSKEKANCRQLASSRAAESSSSL